MAESGFLWRQTLRETAEVLAREEGRWGAWVDYSVQCMAQLDGSQREGRATLSLHWFRVRLEDPFFVDRVHIYNREGEVCVELRVDQVLAGGRRKLDMELTKLFYMLEVPETCDIAWVPSRDRKGLGKLAVALLVSLASGLFDPADQPNRPVCMSLSDAAQGTSGPAFGDMMLSEYRRWTVGIGYYESMGFYRRPTRACLDSRMPGAPGYLDQDVDGRPFTPSRDYYASVESALLDERKYQSAANSFHAGLASRLLMHWSDEELGTVLDNASSELVWWAADVQGPERRVEARTRFSRGGGSSDEGSDEDRDEQLPLPQMSDKDEYGPGPGIVEELDALMDEDVLAFLRENDTAVHLEGKSARFGRGKVRPREFADAEGQKRAALRDGQVEALRDRCGLGSFSVRMLLNLIFPKTSSLWTGSSATVSQFARALELMAPQDAYAKAWKLALLFWNGIANSPEFMRFYPLPPEEMRGKKGGSAKHVMFLFPTPRGLSHVRSKTASSVVDQLMPREAVEVEDSDWLRITAAKIRLSPDVKIDHPLTTAPRGPPTDAAIL